jgi:hypothetical protein
MGTTHAGSISAISYLAPEEDNSLQKGNNAGSGRTAKGGRVFHGCVKIFTTAVMPPSA